jgi:nitrous oxidase accessory protein NosD
MRRVRQLSVVLSAGFALVLAATAQAHGRVVVVGPGDSIQSAVDAAKRGTTIIVRGEHHENVAITTDGITLRGQGAVLEAPANPAANACFDPSSPEDVNGICVVGEADPATGEVVREIQNVTVTGFTIRGFSDSGIIAFGAHDATFRGNVADDNEAYGITAFTSTGTRILFNRASGADEAGFYIGDSPHAGVSVIGNESFDNLFGILIRSSDHGVVVGNYVHGNCLGIPVLADIPGPAGQFTLAANAIRDNTKACPASEDAPFPVSGVGVALLGAAGVRVVGNAITGNVPSGETEFSGGVVVATGLGGTPPTDNHVHGNVILHNQPDLSWDGSGTGNVFNGNRCQTSSPSGLCR